MATRNFTLEISEKEYVGNSVGKHNYNALSLETHICNLSKEFNTDNEDFDFSIFSNKK